MKVTPKRKVQYPSAEMLVQPCFEDYKNELDRYYGIYDKVNVALAFCGAILVIVLGSVDLKYVPAILSASTVDGFIRNAAPFLSSLISAVLIFAATIQLLSLMTSRTLTVFDSTLFRNEHRYFDDPQHTAFLLVVAYTNATHSLRKTVTQKQLAYDLIMRKIIISVVLYAVYIVLKGVATV